MEKANDATTNRQKKYEELSLENENLKKQILDLNAQVAWLMGRLNLANHNRFGASSEKNSAQGTLFDLLEDEQGKASPEQSVSEQVKEVKSYKRRVAGSVGIEKYVHLPHEQIQYPAEEKNCPECGEAMHVIGHEISREELKIVPARGTVVQHVTPNYGCRHCEKHGEHVPIVKTELPPPVISGSCATPETIAYFIYEKIVMGTPIYRIEQDLQRKHIMLSRQTISNWIARVTEDYLMPIYEAMKRKLLSHDVLHADETTVQVLSESGKKAQSKSQMWVYRTSSDAGDHIVIYEYAKTRAKNYPEEFLRGYRGYLHTDGYEVYHSLQGVTAIGCWAHARRKFVEAQKTMPKRAKGSPPDEALEFIGKLYGLEEEFKKLPTDDNFRARQEARRKLSKPIVDEFFLWCKKNTVMTSAHFGRAVSYAIRQEEWLRNYLLDGRLEIDNNRAERSIKPFVIGRKNWLFCNSEGGANVCAVLYSVVETLKENGINPYEYLVYVFKVAPGYEMGSDDVVEKFVPWNYSSGMYPCI